MRFSRTAAMSSDGSITRWIVELESGDIDDAQEELWRRYFHRLLGLAKLKLGETPRAVADEEDVATAALQSFFAGIGEKRFPRLRNRNDLWPLLAKITAHKALDQKRYLMAEKRGKAIRHPAATVDPASSVADWPTELLNRELNPECLVMMNEECNRLMNLLGDNQLRHIARLRFEGFSNAEIAEQLDVIERTVERRLQLIRSIWSQEINNK